MAADPTFVAKGARVGLTTAAAVVHATTAALFITGAAVWFTDILTAFKVVFSLVLMGVGVSVWPWWLGRRRGPEPVALTRAEAPVLFAMVDEMATASGTRRFEVIEVAADYNAATFRRHGCPHLVIGLGLWAVLRDDERVALLAHELGHQAHGDLRRLWFVGGAMRSLRRWEYVLEPPRSARIDRDSVLGGSMYVVAERLLLPLLLFPVFAVVTAARIAVSRSAARQGHCAEHRADLVAAQIASTDATIRTLELLAVANSAGAVLSHAVQRGMPDPWTTLNNYISAMPALERDRRGRAEARKAGWHDSTHPAAHLRIDLLQRVQPHPGTVAPGHDTMQAIEAELDAARTAVGNRLRDARR